VSSTCSTGKGQKATEEIPLLLQVTQQEVAELGCEPEPMMAID
jgi:hypothetical protein